MGEQVLKAKGAKRREEILLLARDVLISSGFSQFSMRDIASRADMKLGNLQYYFPSREELLEAVVRAEFDANLAAVQMIGDASGDGAEALTDAARYLVRQWLNEGACIYAVMSFLAMHEERFRNLHREIYEQFYAALDPLLMRTKPTMKKAERLRKVRLVTSLMDGALLQSRDQFSGKNASVPPRFVDDVVAAILLIAKS